MNVSVACTVLLCYCVRVCFIPYIHENVTEDGTALLYVYVCVSPIIHAYIHTNGDNVRVACNALLVVHVLALVDTYSHTCTNTHTHTYTIYLYTMMQY
jgi:hypothetical protein